MLVNAKPITITSHDHEEDLRREVTSELAMDVANPTVAYACRNCGTIMAFTGPDTTLAGADVPCPECEAVNVL